MTTALDDKTPKVEIGQRWRNPDDGYLMDVVGFCANGWPYVRHPNAKRGGSMVNPGWFKVWERVR